MTRAELLAALAAAVGREPAFGDLVACEILDQRAGDVEDGYVIGWHSIADNVVILATEDYIGMPVNICWCEIKSRGHDALCARLRERYIDRFGTKQIRPLTASAP